MDFLIQSGRQWIAQWHEASPASRWTLGFVIALGCGAIVLAIGWPRQEPREFLFDGVEFSRSELTAMEAAFRYGDEWLDQLLPYIEGNFLFIKDYCEKYIPKLDTRGHSSCRQWKVRRKHRGTAHNRDTRPCCRAKESAWELP